MVSRAQQLLLALGEGLSSILYHNTTLTKLQNILTDNAFKLSTTAYPTADALLNQAYKVNPKKIYYMSTMRTFTTVMVMTPRFKMGSWLHHLTLI